MEKTQRKRRLRSVASELIRKSREAALAAVQHFNNPLITFKSELFIVTMCIAWTYLLHAYYRRQGIEYRYYCQSPGGRRRFERTKHGAFKHWELERCLNERACPLDRHTRNNLRFLIGLRHEIEHQMTTRIDGSLSAKFQACALNYNHYMRQLFGDRHGIDQHLPFSLQFSSIGKEQIAALPSPEVMPTYIQGYITGFEEGLSPEEFNSPRFAYRVLFVPKTANRKGQADQVIEFVRADSEIAKDLNRAYAVIKETEKPKYLPGQIAEMMRKEGYKKFRVHHHTDLWKSANARAKSKGYGVYVGKQWYWYESWIQVVRRHCKDNAEKYR